MLDFLKRLFRPGPAVGPQEAVRLIDAGAVVIDVRTQTEFREGHIPGARHLPLDRLRREGARALDGLDLPAGRPVLLACRSGARSRLAQSLIGGGDRFVNLAGGVLAWHGAALPLRTGAGHG